MDRLLIATGNAGKLAEFRALFAPRGLQVVGQRELGIVDPEETGATFVENALLKARHASALSGLPCLADDSGLCVEALGGAPGLHSARYAGAQADARANIRRLLDALDGVPAEERGAHFVCVLVYVRHADDPQPIIAEGELHGEILSAPRGKDGFGYDPLFYLPDRACTLAELGHDEKNRISHRARAMQQLVTALRERI